MAVTGGYDGKTSEDEPLKPPEECEWEVRLISVGSQVEGVDDSHYATITIDGAPAGSVRLPSPDYVRYLREKVQNA